MIKLRISVWFCGVVIFLFQSIEGQSQIYFRADSQIQMFSDQISARIQNQENQYKLVYQRATHNTEISYLRQIYRSEENSVVINISIHEDKERLTTQNNSALTTSDGAVGIRLPNLGEEAIVWASGKIRVRNGKALIHVQVYPKEYFMMNSNKQNDNVQNAEENKNSTQLDNNEEQPANESKKQPKRKDIAVQFATHILAFFEAQSK